MIISLHSSMQQHIISLYSSSAQAPSAHMWTPPKIGRANSKVTTTRDGVGEMQRGKASASL